MSDLNSRIDRHLGALRGRHLLARQEVCDWLLDLRSGANGETAGRIDRTLAGLPGAAQILAADVADLLLDLRGAAA